MLWEAFLTFLWSCVQSLFLALILQKKHRALCKITRHLYTSTRFEANSLICNEYWLELKPIAVKYVKYFEWIQTSFACFLASKYRSKEKTLLHLLTKFACLNKTFWRSRVTNSKKPNMSNFKVSVFCIKENIELFQSCQGLISSQ